MSGPLRTPRGHRSPASRLMTAAVAMATVASTILPAGGAVAAPLASAPVDGSTVDGSTAGTAITLITGDVVRLVTLTDGTQAVELGESLQTTGAQTLTVNDDLFVYPTRALPLVASGLVDGNLFNVTELVADGYDDASTDTIPVIVQYADGTPRDTQRDTMAGVPGVATTAVLPSIDGAALGIAKDDAAAAWSALTRGAAESRSAAGRAETGPVEKIWLDGKVQAALDVSVPLIGAPELWDLGYDGTGVDIAVLDSGVDAAHPDLVDHIDTTMSFVPGQDANVDPYGHGTHVASIAAGTGAASDGLYTGVAPGASLMIGKVLGDDGFGQESWIIEGLQWAADNGADIVNMSLGSDVPTDGTDPMSAAVNTITEESGTLFVIAAGNMGVPGTIAAPGAADEALTVGGTDDTDTLAWFTSQGPRVGDHAVKPDLAAPGDSITAARSAQSFGSGYYTVNSGTSMSTPHVAGGAALLKQLHPGWTAQELKDALVSHAKPLDAYTPYQVGTGRVDLPSALDPIRATGNVWSGFFDWPHDDGEAPTERTVTYSNEGAEAVHLTLDLRVEAPDGAFSLSSPEIDVPAGGSTAVVLTGDPTVLTAGTDVVGTLVAVDDDGIDRTRTSIGISSEAELYDMNMTALDRAGAPVGGIAVVVNLDTGYAEQIPLDDATGTATIRRPPATYAVMTTLTVQGEQGAGSIGWALLGNPDVVLDHDQEVVFDAREANLISAQTWKGDNVDQRFRRVDWYRAIGSVSVIGGFLAPVTVDSMYAAPTAPVAEGEFEYAARWRIAKPLISIRHDGDLLDELVVYGGTQLDMKGKLDVVDVGYGTPADWAAADVAGKAVTVTRSDAVTPMALAQAANDGGAVLLIAVNDRDGVWSDTFTKEDWTLTSNMTVTLRKEEGSALVDDVRAGGARLKVTASADTPYVIDLMDARPTAIPSDLTYAPAKADLARVKTRYKADTSSSAAEFRWDLRPYAAYGVGFFQTLTVPDKRVEFVTPGDTRWHQDVQQMDANGNITLESRDTLHTLDSPGRSRVSYFGPVIRPRLGGEWWRPYRTGDQMVINMPYATDGGLDHGGAAGWGVDTLAGSFYEGDTLLRTSIDQTMYPPTLSPDNKQYRYVLDVQRDPGRWESSTSTHTEWTFWSSHTDPLTQSPLALLQLDYRLKTNLAGHLTKHATTIGVRASHMAELEHAPEVTSVTLEVSTDDGATWSTVELTDDGSGWLVGNLPSLTPDAPFVSLRASATDADGNAITQQVVRAASIAG